MKKVIETVQKFIHQHRLLTDKARVVVGLSGGPDSVCLALMLHQLHYEVVAVHCNFQLRGEESTRDELFVERLCRQWGWEHERMRFDTQAYAHERHLSIEMAARELRYQALRDIREKHQAEAIAVGHHQDDNAETLLLNLARGTGIKGLCGMQPKHDDIIRPLLCLSRQEILSYLHAIGQDYVTDHTNLEDDFARNKVRLNILPQLEAINQGALPNITSTIENLNEVQQVYRQAIASAIDECCRQNEVGERCIDIGRLTRQPSPISVLHELLSPIGFNKGQLKDILASLGESGRIFTANRCRLLIDRQDIIIEAPHYPMPDIHQEVVPAEALTLRRDPRHAYLDADKLHGKLTLRTPRQGDTFAPFGMNGKRRLLSDYLTDQKLSLFQKEHQPLLMDGEEIVWVVGRRSSDLYRVDATTRRVIALSV